MQTHFESVRQTIVSRKTEKVLADVQSPIVYPEVIQHEYDQLVRNAVAAAGMAPFHFERNVDDLAEPWRVYLLTNNTCRLIAKKLGDWFELKPSNKIPSMLAACGSLVLVNWLPQFRGSDPSGESALPREKQLEIDDEHLAASAALVQNLLLLLTASGLGTYWSSGGQLGFKEMFTRLGIDHREKLVAAVFVEYPDGRGEITERIPGKNRALRSDSNRWCKKIDLT